jgi:ATP-dependent Zn protease
MEEDNEEIKHTAFHEAGHAVTGYRLHFYGYELSIIPDDEGWTLGHHEQEGWDLTRPSAINKIIVFYAGAEADRLAFPGMEPEGTDSDDQQASDLLRYVPNETEENLRAESSRLVKENWEAISAIAEELLESKKLDSEEWAIIIDAIDEGGDWHKVLPNYRESMKALRSWDPQLKPMG